MLELFEKRKIVDHVKEMGEYLTKKLNFLADRYPVITGRRGTGLIQGLEFSVPVASIVNQALIEQKLVLISAGANVIRFVPPLVIEKEHVDEMVKKLEEILKHHS